MNHRWKTQKVFSCLMICAMLVSVPAVRSEAAVITSNATDKAAVIFQEGTAYSAGDYVIYDGEMYICTDDTQGAWDAVGADFMQITKNHELGTSEDLSASYDASADPSEERSLMAFAANAWQKLKGFFGMGSKDEELADANQYKNASVSAKLNFLQKQNQQLDRSVADLQDWVSRSFSSVSNGKSTLAATITDRGVQVGAQDTFQKFDQAIRDLALLQYNNGRDKGRADGLKEGYDNGYSAGVAFADSNVNEDSASYKKGLSVFQPQIWTAEIRIDKDGANKEQECFSRHDGISSNHVEYSFYKEFKDHTIIAVYKDEFYFSPFGSSASRELVCLAGNEYLQLSDTKYGALSVSKESIFWGNVSFNIIDTGVYDTLKLKVVYI